MGESSCIFCRIIAGEAAAHRVYEDDHVVSFMDAFPVTDGHTLVVTRQHCTDLFAVPEAVLQSVASASRKIAHAIRETLAPAGLMVFQLNGAAAGQTVFHYHMHLMPRADGEPMALHSRTPGNPERLAEIARNLAAALGAP